MILNEKKRESNQKPTSRINLMKKQAPQTPAMTAPRLSIITIIQILCLSVVVVLLFQSSFSYPLAFESPDTINNTVLQTTLDNSLSFKSLLNDKSITKLSFAINYLLSGSNKTSFRIVNLSLHILNLILLLYFMRTLFRFTFQCEEKRLNKTTLSWATFFAVAILAFNPISVYAITYIIQREMLLATLFSLLTLISFYHGIFKQNLSWFVLSALCYFLAVHSSDRTTLLPIIIILLAFIIERPSIRLFINVLFQLLLYLPTALHIIWLKHEFIGLFHLAWTKKVLASFSANIAKDLATSSDFSMSTYFLSIMEQSRLFFKYLYLAIIPDTALMAIHIPVVLPTSTFSYSVVIALTLFCVYPAIGLLLLIQRGTKGLFGFFILFSWILFLSEISVIQTQTAFELSRIYLWLIGPISLIALILIFIPYRIKWFVTVAYLLLLVSVLFNRLDSFKTPLNLWHDACSKITQAQYNSPSAHRPFFHLGKHLLKTGKNTEAIEAFNNAISLEPLLTPGHYNLGIAYSNQGSHNKAITAFLKASALAPDNHTIFYNIGNEYLALNEPSQAIGFYEMSLQRNSIHTDSQHNLAIALFQLGKTDEAIQKYQAIIKTNPKFSKAYYNLGNALVTQGKTQEAIKYYEQALAINPDDYLTLHSLAQTKWQAGDVKKAIELIQKSLSINPDFKHSKDLLNKIIKSKDK